MDMLFQDDCFNRATDAGAKYIVATSDSSPPP